MRSAPLDALLKTTVVACALIVLNDDTTRAARTARDFFNISAPLMGGFLVTLGHAARY
jgi:hypothetical protein